jgi:hypothetical protein
MTNESFITWMRTSGLSNIRKIYGKIENLEPGNYSLLVKNNFDTTEYKATKSLVISNSNTYGG